MIMDSNISFLNISHDMCKEYSTKVSDLTYITETPRINYEEKRLEIIMENQSANSVFKKFIRIGCMLVEVLVHAYCERLRQYYVLEKNHKFK